MKTVLAISSTGGHWIQLKRLSKVFEMYNTIYVCTAKKKTSNSKFYQVEDASRWNKLKLVVQLFQVLKIVFKEKPNIIITTGASVGVWAMLFGKIIGSKCIWIDSIANYQKLSLSGRIASFIGAIVLTQWEHLSTDKIIFKGNVI